MHKQQWRQPQHWTLENNEWKEPKAINQYDVDGGMEFLVDAEKVIPLK